MLWVFQAPSVDTMWVIIPYYPPIMENQMEKNMENEMETRGM